MSEIAACTLIQEEPDRKTERYLTMFKDYPEDVKRTLRCADNKATKLLRELKEFGLIERKRRGLGKPSLVYPQQTIHLLRCILIAVVLVMHQNVVGSLDLFRLLFQLAVNPAVNLPVIINQAVLL